MREKSPAKVTAGKGGRHGEGQTALRNSQLASPSLILKLMSTLISPLRVHFIAIEVGALFPMAISAPLVSAFEGPS